MPFAGEPGQDKIRGLLPELIWSSPDWQSLSAVCPVHSLRNPLPQDAVMHLVWVLFKGGVSDSSDGGNAHLGRQATRRRLPAHLGVNVSSINLPNPLFKATQAGRRPSHPVARSSTGARERKQDAGKLALCSVGPL